MLQLYHALKAFSALSMAHSQGVQGLNALQHYSKALPLLQNSLHTDGDLSSDGALLTHFVLLLYEVSHHISKIMSRANDMTRSQLQSREALIYGCNTSINFFESLG